MQGEGERITEPKGNKWCTKLFTTHWPISSLQRQVTPPTYKFVTTFCDMENSLSQFWPCALAMLPRGFLCSSSLEVHGTLKNLWLQESSRQELKHSCVFNIILIPNPNHTTVPDTKKMNSVQVKTRTLICLTWVYFSDKSFYGDILTEKFLAARLMKTVKIYIHFWMSN